ncbi:MAG: hypothetical protein Q8P02_03365 [Candidatus Micrarchaeota archaeon]|nr:hypothetical protein [Candidatus Micrarchaeota archaeon]
MHALFEFHKNGSVTAQVRPMQVVEQYAPGAHSKTGVLTRQQTRAIQKIKPVGTQTGALPEIIRSLAAEFKAEGRQWHVDLAGEGNAPAEAAKTRTGIIHGLMRRNNSRHSEATNPWKRP